MKTKLSYFILLFFVSFSVFAQDAFMGYDYSTSSYPLAWSTTATTFNSGTNREVVFSNFGGSINSATVCNTSSVTNYQLNGGSAYIEISLTATSSVSSIGSFIFTGSTNNTTNAGSAGIVFCNSTTFSLTSIIGAFEAPVVASTGNWSQINVTPPTGTKSLRIYRRIFFNSSSGVAQTTAASGFLQYGAGTTIRTASIAVNVLASITEPTTQATNVAFSNVLSNSFTTSWTNGDGANRVVFMKEGSQGTIADPTDGSVYAANANWNNGSPTGSQLATSGYYCVYNGNASTVNISNLNASTTYWVQVFDYNGTTTSTNYLLATATGNPASQATPTAPAVTFYRSSGSGDWSDSAIWETSTDNSIWGAASVYPDFNNSNAITIKNGHTVSISGATIIADQLVVEASAVLVVASNATLTIADGTADDLIINGNLELLGTFSSLTGATTIVNGVFENKVNAPSFSAGSGSISVSAGGTYKINGYTGTSAYAFTNTTFVAGIGVAGSNYYVASGAPRITNSMNLANVIWDSPTVGGSFLNNPSSSISGNFTMLSSPGINHGAGGSGRSLLIEGDLIIEGGKYEISGLGAIATNNLTVNGNIILNAGTFNLSSSTSAAGIGNLYAKGNITLNDGFFGIPSGISNGNLLLNGTIAQSLLVGTNATAIVQNFTVSNSAGISILGNSTLDVQGDLNFGNVNNAVVNTGGKLKFVSNQNFTGRVADITNNGNNSGNTISGDVIVERYIPSGKRAFRFLTPGVSTSDFISNNWQLGTHITGSTTGANGFDSTLTGNPSMYTYNNQILSGTGWSAIPNTNTTNLTAGQGYRLLIRGDRSVDLNAASQNNMNYPVTLSAKGNLLNGSVTFDATSNIAINNTTNTTTADYSLIGNPYVSSVDWHNVTKTGIEDFYYTWDPNLGTPTERGRYVVYSQSLATSSIQNGTGSTNIGRYIQSGQAFFVKNTTNGVAGSLTFNENNKVNNQLNVFRINNTSTNHSKIFVNLFDAIQFSTNAYPIDGALAILGTDFTSDYGYGDVKKMETSGQNVMFLRNTNKLAIEAINEPLITDELQLRISNLLPNTNYTWKIDLVDYTSINTPYLLDNLDGTITPISSIQVINFSTTTSANSIDANRFKIIFSPTILATNTFELNASVYPNPSTKEGINIAIDTNILGSKVEVYNTLGQNIPVAVNSLNEKEIHIKPTSNIQSGVYYIQISLEGRSKVIKWVIN